MTKLKVYQPSDKEEEKTVYLKLEPGLGDTVNLITVDKNGTLIYCGRLLELRNGRVHLCTGVDPSLGFDLDDEGCIKLIK